MFIQPQPFDEAIAKLGARTPQASALRSEGWRAVPTDLRERTFFSSGVEDVRFLQQAQDFLRDSLKGTKATNDAGESYVKIDRTKFIEQMREYAIRNGMGPLDPDDANTLKDIRSVGRLGLIFDVNVQAANDYGYWKQGMDPDVLEAFPAQRFVRVHAVKVPRPYHVANTGAVRRKDDLEFWLNMNRDFGVPWGPWGYGSGMGVEDVGRSDAEARGLVKPGEKMPPVDRKFNDHLAASVKGLSQGMLQQLQGLFGKNVKIEGDEIVWVDAGRSGPTVPTPTPAAASVVPANPAAKPVSAAISITVTPPVRAELDHTLKIIDSVHTDGDLVTIPVKAINGSNLGQFRHSPTLPVDIGVKALGDWPALTLVHEIGHYLDFWTMGHKMTFASKAHPALEGWRRVIAKSDAVRAIRGLASRQQQNYFLSEVELWARSYAQFIATESKDPLLLSQLKKTTRYQPWRQWTDADFAPIGDEIRAVLKMKGWM